MHLPRWFNRKTPLEVSLLRSLGSEGNLEDALKDIEVEAIRTRGEAEAICKILSDALENPPKHRAGLDLLLRLIGRADYPNDSPKSVIMQRGFPLILQIAKRSLQHPEQFEENASLTALRLLALSCHPMSRQLVVQAATSGFHSDNYLWSGIFNTYDQDHPETHLLFSDLTDTLPPGLIAVHLLDSANRLMLEGLKIHHPFDSDAGTELLTKWMTDPNEENFDVASTCTTALPFLIHPRSNELLNIAMNHPSVDIQLEAAWAGAKLEHPAGLKALRQMCKDVRHSKRAQSYMKELHLEDDIPAECRNPDFLARSEFAGWLAHPNELGKCPDTVEIVDHRVLRWPPEYKPIPVWLVSYRAKQEDPFQEDDCDIGMVGSVTFCLFSSDLDQRPPEDSYAIHCCWELEQEDLLTDDAVTSSEYDFLFSQWEDIPPDDAAMERVMEIDPKLQYAQRIVGVASGKFDGEPGWLVLDGSRSSWYPACDFPDEESSRQVLRIHIGRNILALGNAKDRRKHVSQKTEKPAASVIESYEDLLARAEQGTPGQKAKLLSGRSYLGRYFPNYIEACATAQGANRAELTISTFEKILFLAQASTLEPAEIYDSFAPLGERFPDYVDACAALKLPWRIFSLIAVLEPYNRHNLGHRRLGEAAYKAGNDLRAKEFLLKLKAGMENWRKCPEMIMLAEIQVREGDHEAAREMLLECLRFEIEDSRESWVQDRPIHEKRFARLREAFLRIFHPDASTLKSYGLPDQLF